MELSVPKIEVLGYLISDIQDDDKTWFQFSGVYFNARLERTERYCLFEIPFFKERLTKLTVISTAEEIESFVAPFVLQMKNDKLQWEKETGKIDC